MSNPLKPYEIYLGAFYALLELFVLPFAASFLNLYLQLPLWALNCLLFCVNFLAMTAIFHRLLWQDLKASLSRLFHTLRWAGLGLLCYYALGFAVNVGILLFVPDYINLNNQTVSDFALEGGWIMALCTVLLVPVAEELLFRGLLFRGVYEKSKPLAWIVSTLAFSAVHIIGYIGEYTPVMLLVALVQYLPAGFCLALAYRKSDSIWAPILMHIAINQISMQALQFL